MKKNCVDCGVAWSLDGFYRGVPQRCKECHKAKVRAWYYRTLPERSAYEARRFKEPSRKENLLEYQRARRKRSPEKNRARNAVSNAVRDGRLVRKPCEVCGSVMAQAHHEDYAKPLDVRWFCFKHHREVEHGQIVTTMWAGRAHAGSK